MIFIEHYEERITSNLSKGEDVVTGLYKQAALHPDEGLILFKKGIETISFLAMLNSYYPKPLLVSNSNMFNEDLEYIEDRPFMNINEDVIYPTWVKGTSLIYIHASLVNQVRDKVAQDLGLLYWINTVSKLTRAPGVLSYQAPVAPLLEKMGTLDLYRFVAEHYKKRWTLLLLFNHIYYEKRFPFYAFAKAQFYKQRQLELDIASLQRTASNTETDQLDYDVIIPTVGRPQYLYDVLKDLNKQSIVPSKVIIVEQDGDKKAQSLLDEILSTQWNFELAHNFTHITGACRARNEGVLLSTSPWILFFDDDVRVEKNFISQAVQFISNTKAKCITFACLQDGEKEEQLAYKQWESFGSGCSLVHKDIFSKCSFDMALEHGYGEDMDYGMQIRNLGEDIIYAPQIQIRHLKAPVGGFREPHTFPWESDEVQPKPSPQIMYFRKKNFTEKQLQGYKMMQFFKTYGFFKTKNPYKHIKKFKKAWAQSEKWASILKNINH